MRTRGPAASEVDETDLRIIACLQASARRSNTEIALELGLSEATIRRHLSRMLDADLLRIVAVADPLKIGYPVVAIIGLQVMPSMLAEVERQLAELPEFRFIGMTSGPWDFVAEAWFPSLADLADFITQDVGAIAGIQRMETEHVLRMVRYTYDWGRPSLDGSGLPASRVSRRTALPGQDA